MATTRSASELIAEGRAGADEHYGDLLVVCEAMRDFALEVGQAWPGRALEAGPVDRPLAILFARTTRTYWATLELLRMSFGDQAAMLTRSLFEDMVDAHYICVEPDAAIDRLPKHAEHADMVMSDALRNDPALVAGESLPTYDLSRRAELNTLFGPFGTKGCSNPSDTTWPGCGRCLAVRDRALLLGLALPGALPSQASMWCHMSTTHCQLPSAWRR